MKNRALEWMSEAACRDSDPDIFFPEGRISKVKIEKARMICIACPVQNDCWSYARRLPGSGPRGGHGYNGNKDVDHRGIWAGKVLR